MGKEKVEDLRILSAEKIFENFDQGRKEFVPIWLFLIIWISAFLIHLLSFLYLFIMTMLHLLLRTPGEQNTVGIKYRWPSIICHAILCVLHLYATISMLCCCMHCRKTNSKDPTRFSQKTSKWRLIRWYYSFRNWNEKYLGETGVFGDHGPLFEYRLALRECIEIPSQTYQAWLMSNHLINRVNSVAYAGIITINCFTSPLMLMSKRYTVRRRITVLLDGIFDFIFSVIYPIFLVIDQIYEYVVLRDLSLIKDPVWFQSAILIMQQIMVTSFRDFITKMLPFIFNYFMLRGLIKSIYESRSRNDVVPSDRLESREISIRKSVSQGRTMSQVHRFMQNQKIKKYSCLLSLLWGVALVCAVAASSFRDQCPEGCKAAVSPWFSSDCRCIVIRLDCEKNQLRTTQLLEESLLNYSSTTRSIHLERCLLPSGIPSKAMKHFTGLRFIYIIFSQMKEWNISSSDLPYDIYHLEIDYSNLTKIPSALHNPPPYFNSFRITNGLIKEILLPDNIGTLWKNVQYCRLEGQQLTHWPDFLMHLPGLKQVDIRRNRLKEIPKGLSKLPISILEIDNNQIKSLPDDLINSASLTQLYVEGNPISFSFSWNSTLHGLKTLSMSNTPMCLYENQNPDNIQEMMRSLKSNFPDLCKNQCQTGCSQRTAKNRVCDLTCFNNECDYDGFDCDRYELLKLTEGS